MDKNSGFEALTFFRIDHSNLGTLEYNIGCCYLFVPSKYLLIRSIGSISLRM